jgi:hypothetical protein
LDSQDRAAFEDIEILTVSVFGELLQKLWLPLTAGVSCIAAVNKIVYYSHPH